MEIWFQDPSTKSCQLLKATPGIVYQHFVAEEVGFAWKFALGVLIFIAFRHSVNFVLAPFHFGCQVAATWAESQPVASPIYAYAARVWLRLVMLMIEPKAVHFDWWGAGHDTLPGCMCSLQDLQGLVHRG